MHSAPPQPTVQLAPDQIAFYHREGYLTLPPLTTPVELAWIREQYDLMFQQQAGRDHGNHFDLAGTDEDGKPPSLPQILNPERYVPAFANTLLRANAVSVGRQLLGLQAEGGSAHCIFKPARVGAETPWHQDEAYWNPALDYQSMSIWVPLQPATLDNGCMWFVPRSHHLEVLPHHHLNHDPRIHGLMLDDHQKYTANAVACPLPPGGATVHPGRTLHYTGPNRSDIPRRAYIFSAALPAAKRTDGRRFPWLEEEKSTHARKRDQDAQAAAQRVT